MSRRITAERLNEEGLDYHERLVRLEKTIYGTTHVPGLVDHADTQLGRIQDLESVDRRRRLPFFLRWFLPARQEKPAC
jgi:heme oxygenase